MDMTKCDRCGKLYIDADLGDGYESVSVEHIKTDADIKELFDYCKPCFKRFKRFLKKFNVSKYK